MGDTGKGQEAQSFKGKFQRIVCLPLYLKQGPWAGGGRDAGSGEAAAGLWGYFVTYSVQTAMAL